MVRCCIWFGERASFVQRAFDFSSVSASARLNVCLTFFIARPCLLSTHEVGPKSKNLFLYLFFFMLESTNLLALVDANRWYVKLICIDFVANSAIHIADTRTRTINSINKTERFVLARKSVKIKSCLQIIPKHVWELFQLGNCVMAFN